MKKLQKMMLALGTVATVVAPMAAVVSCGSSEADSNPSTLSIVAEKGWVPTMEAIATKFKTDNADMLKDNGITDIKVVEAGAFEMADRLSTKGYKDSGVSDIVLLPGDRMSGMMEQGYIKAFSEHTLDAFAKAKIGTDVSFLKGAIQAAAPGLDNNGTPSDTSDDDVYAVPENVESMVAWNAGDKFSATGKTFTSISDLWKANGFFNTDTVNLRDIVDTSGDVAKFNPNLGGVGKTLDFLKAGFTKMIGGTKYAGDMLNSSADVATPKIQQYWGANKDTANIIAGPWEKKDLKDQAAANAGNLTPEQQKVVDAYQAEQQRVAEHNSQKDIKDEDKIEMNEDIVKAYKDLELHGTVTAGQPTSYNQWAGGWNFTLNARINDKKQSVAEAFIGDILKAENAQSIYDAMAKMSPTDKGKEVIDPATPTSDTADVHEMYVAAENLQARPVAAEFGVVWGAYADTIQGLTTDIEDYGKIADSTDPTAVKKLDDISAKFATNFQKAIETALNKA